jgi:hypothetical protein
MTSEAPNDIVTNDVTESVEPKSAPLADKSVAQAKLRA